MSIKNPNIRYELFFKGRQELIDRVKFLSQRGATSFNLVNKNKKDTMEEWVEIIQKTLPECSVCAHYSLKYNRKSSRQGGDDASYEKIKSFLRSAPILKDKHAKQSTEVLLISGSGEKATLDPIKVLRRLKTDQIAALPIIGVAYNPFFQSDNDRAVERDRLVMKLETKLVNKVYFQFGTNLEFLRSTLNWMKELQSQYNFSVCGSIFLPTKKLIAQQKFRPWNGVFLSDEFLSSPANANKIVVKMIQLYKEYECEILFEAPGVRNEKDFAEVEKLLKFWNENSNKMVYCDSTEENTSKHTNSITKETSVLTVKRRKLLCGADKSKILPSPLVSQNDLTKPAILLFGSHDIRTHDNEAFQLASLHAQVTPVFLWDKGSQDKWRVVGALQVVMKEALKNLQQKLRNYDLDLICRATNDVDTELMNLCNETGSCVVYWNKEQTTESRIREERIANTFQKKNIKNSRVPIITTL